MQYVRCIVSRPGLFDNIKLEFRQGLNVVMGKNGSGKSLLAKGLVDGLWNMFSRGRLLPDEIWNGLYLDLLFTLEEGKEVQFTSTGQKRLAIQVRDKGTGAVLASGEYADGGEAAPPDLAAPGFGDSLRSLVSGFDFDLMVNSSFIPSPSDFDISRLISYPDVQRVILSDRSGFFRKQTSLKKFFEKGNVSNNRVLSEILKFENISKNLNREIQLIEIQNARSGKLKKEREAVWREIENFKIRTALLGSRVEILYKIYDSLDAVEEYQKSFSKISEEVEKEKEKINSISELKSEIESSFPQFRNFRNVSNTYLDQLQRIYNEIRNLNEKIDNLYSRLEFRKEMVKKIGYAVNFSSLAVILSVLYKNDFSLNDNILLLTGLFGFSLIFTLIAVLYYIATSGTRKFNRLNNEKKELEERLRKILEESNLELEGYKLSELYEFLLQYFEDFIQYSESVEDIRNISRSLKDRTDLRTIKKELDVIRKRDSEARKEIDRYVSALDMGGEIELDKNKIREHIARSESEIRSLEKQLELKKGILEQIDTEMNQNPVDEGRIDSLRTEKSRVDRILGSLVKTEKSIDFIIEVIDDAVRRTEEVQLNRLVNSVYERFNFLTGNQYVAQIDKDLIRGMITGTRPGGDLNPIMAHLLLLAVKVSLTDFFTGGDMSLPLIIDDPFLLMDDDRTGRFREIITGVAEKRQVVIFTHRRDKSDWGNYLELK